MEFFVCFLCYYQVVTNQLTYDKWSVRFSSSGFKRKTGRSSNRSFYTFSNRKPSLFCLLTVRFTQLPILEALPSLPNIQ